MSEQEKVISKVVRPGTVKVYESQRSDVFCKIEVQRKTKGLVLSITGVVGPTVHGNAAGSCGQIVMDWRGKHAHNPKVEFAPGWSQELFDKFLDVWDRWHLNDMEAACEHQRADQWGQKELVLQTYKLKTETYKKREAIEERAKTALLENRHAQITEEEQHLLSLPWEIVMPGESTEEYGLLRAALGEHYDLAKDEKKMSGWVYEKQHPEGVLSKPCPTCGYKYGSAWLCETLPQEVIDFLAGLPDSDKRPAWV